MGVHGLTTFLHENKRALSKSVQHTTHSAESIRTPVVVDAWSFIYKLYQDSGLSWVYGGEYPEFTALVIRTIQAWIDVGFEVYFVFDGPCPEIKFPTVTLRLCQSQIQHSLLFFRTSQSSRSTGRFLNETRILPPLARSACVLALLSMAERLNELHVHFADEEGDPFAVELAGRVGGYVIGNDSDFVVLNSEGYKGYIPLDEMTWLPPESLDAPPDEDPDGEFQTVRKPKARKKATSAAGVGKGIIPSDSDTLTLLITTYSPDRLAAHLKIPVTLLPLLGALVGNDFTSRSENSRRNVQTQFFERHLTLGQRIERAASTIHKILNPDPHKNRVKHNVGSVMDLITRAVNTLLARWTSLGSGEIEQIIENIVNATLQYAIPKYQGTLVGRDSLWPTEICPLHDPDTCSLLPMVSHLFEGVDADRPEADENTQQLIELRGMYLGAYRRGLVPEKAMDILSTASYWPRLFLENPDVETVGRTIGRPIRLWMYAILADSIGLCKRDETEPEPNLAAISGQANTSDMNEDGDEIVDVVEPNSEDEEPDLLAPLKGELRKLHLPQQEESLAEEQTHAPPSRLNNVHATPKTFKIIEHIRRGTRIAEETIDVVPLAALFSILEAPFFPSDQRPFLLGPQTDALTVLLRALRSDSPQVRALKAEQLTVALSLRWVVYTLWKRANESPSKERDQERWTQREARCFLASFTWSSETLISDNLVGINERPPVTDRNVQLSAQILASLESIDELSAVLLIPDLIPHVSRQFSGKKFHALLTGVIPLDETAVPDPLWNACLDGLEKAFSAAKEIFTKRRKNAVVASISSETSSSQIRSFALLSESTA